MAERRKTFPGLRPLRRAQAAFAKRLQRRTRTVAGAGLAALILLSAFSCSSPQPVQTVDHPPIIKDPGEPWVRVLLVEDADSATLAVKGLCAVHTADPRTGEALGHAAVAQWDGLGTSTVRAEGAGLLIEGHGRLSGAVILRAKTAEAFTVNGAQYRGELVLRPDRGKLRIINGLALEDYLCGVIGKEMPLSFPEEALKAQAIAARSYAIQQLRRGAKPGDHDVKSDARSQVYGGMGAESPKSRAVVAATRALIATFDGKPFVTYYHSTCGGQTIPAEWIFGGAPVGALAGADCGRCTGSKYHRWSKVVPRPEAIAALRKSGLNLVDPVGDFETVSWGRGGYQKAVRVRHAGGTSELAATRFRTALGLRSTSFGIVSVAGGDLEISGQGWGHGVGLCQVGAKGFAAEGMTAELIIDRYYPGAKLQKGY